MKINNSFGVILTGILVVTVVACAEYKVKEHGDAEVSSSSESESKKDRPQMTSQGYSRADASDQIKSALVAAKRAEELGGLWRDTTKLLKKANAALKKNDNDKAYKVATFAKGQAEMALNQSYLEKANHMIGRVKGMADNDDPKMLGRVTDAEAAYLGDNGEKAYAMSLAMLEEIDSPFYKAEAVNVVVKSKPIKPAQKETLMKEQAMTEELPDVVDQDHDIAMENAMQAQMNSPTAPAAVNVSETSSNKMDMDDQYKVMSGDSLWLISSLPAIYSNPYQWPLIYKTNKDTIRDPDLIQVGQVLNIDREASEAEIDAAVNHAKSRGAWSLGEKESFDQAYLSDSDLATR